MIRSLGELSGLEFVARIGIERDKDKPDDTGRNVIKAALGADHAEYARVMGSVPQPPQQGQFIASGPQLADNGTGQSGAPSSGSAPFWAR